MNEDADATLLPEWFAPTDRDVICGWARQNHRHAGNQRFRQLVEQSAPLYVAARTKLEKTQVIASLVQRVRNESPGGGFVKRDFHSGRWYEIGDDKARDKVGHAIRRAVDEGKKRKGGGTKHLKSGKRKIAAGEEKLETIPSRAQMLSKSHQEQKDALGVGGQFAGRSPLAIGDNMLGPSFPSEGVANTMLEPRMFPSSTSRGGGHSMQQFMAVPPSDNFLFAGTGQSTMDTAQARSTALSAFSQQRGPPPSASLLDFLNSSGSGSEVPNNPLLNVSSNLAGLANISFPSTMGVQNSNDGTGGPSGASFTSSNSAIDSSLSASTLGNLESRLGIGMTRPGAGRSGEAMRNTTGAQQSARNNFFVPPPMGREGTSQLAQYSLPPFASPQEDPSTLAQFSSQPFSSSSRTAQSYLDILRDHQPTLRDLNIATMLGTATSRNIPPGIQQFPGTNQSSGRSTSNLPSSRDGQSFEGLPPPG